MFASIARLSFVLAFTVAALAAPDASIPTRTTRNDHLGRFNPVDIVAHSLITNPSVPLTNAQRLSRGLPLNRPRAHHDRRRDLRPRQSSTCLPRTGVIAVNIQGETPQTGYLSRLSNPFGEYLFTNNRADALSISFCLEDTTGFFDIVAQNGLANFQYLGATVGFASTSDNLDPGSSNYAFVAGTTQVPRGPAINGPNSFSAASGLAVKIESTIWQLIGDQISPSWMNTDGSTPAIQIVYVPSENAFVITGDVGQFRSNFGSGDVATLKFVSA